MFSDFREHVIGVPQVAPSFGNVLFDGPGRERGLRPGAGHRARPADRYAFRTSPLRNVALQPAFMHNGAFVRLEDAIRHHLDAEASTRTYSPATSLPICADRPVRSRRCSSAWTRRSARRSRSTDAEFADLVDFVRDGLLDPAAAARSACGGSSPSGSPAAGHRSGSSFPDGLGRLSGTRRR